MSQYGIEMIAANRRGRAKTQAIRSVASVPLWHIPSVARWRTLAAAVLVATTLPACKAQSRAPLHVSAAVSLTESLTAAVRQWERETGETVTLNFAASNVLSRQIEEGAPADLFISADMLQMERLVVRRLVPADSVVTLLSNQLVVVTPADRPLPGPAPGGLADPRVARVALGDPSAVPAGIYARQWLERIDLWPAVSAKVVPTSSVRAAMAAVESGNADAAITYRTDVRGGAGVRVEYPGPHRAGPGQISYPIGVVAASRQGDKARALLSWLRGEVAAGIFTAAGFSVPAASTRPVSAELIEVIGLTVSVGLVATLVMLPPGIALAWWLARTRSPLRSVVETLVAVPLVLPPVATGYLLLRLLGRRGPLGAWLDQPRHRGDLHVEGRAHRDGRDGPAAAGAHGPRGLRAGHAPIRADRRDAGRRTVARVCHHQPAAGRPRRAGRRAARRSRARSASSARPSSSPAAFPARPARWRWRCTATWKPGETRDATTLLLASLGIALVAVWVSNRLSREAA